MGTAHDGNRRGDFETLVIEVADPVRRYLRRRTDHATADDVLSETLVVLWRRPRASISDGVVTLDVTETLVGDPGSVVEVAQGDGMISDGGPLVFEDGATYLLATSDGVILSCGLSGIASPELESIYAEAADLH